MTKDSIINTVVTPSSFSDHEASNFLSLKWKILMLSSLILCVMVVSFCTVSYLGQMANFENMQDTEYQRHVREVNALIKNSSQNLHQIVETIPFLEGMAAAMREDNGENISHVFDRHWSLLQFNNGVEFVHFYNKSNQRIASWNIHEPVLCGQNARFDCANDAILRWVNHVNQYEKPASPLFCVESCKQLIIAPLLVEGEKVGVVAMGVSLADTFLRFKSITETDIGLFIKHHKSFNNQNDTVMSAWDIRVTALTNKKKNILLLQQAEHKFQDIANLKDGVEIIWNNQYQQIKLFPLAGSADLGSQAYFVVITDVTRAVRNIHESVWKIAFIGLFGLIFSEILLFIILTRLLFRLKSFSFSLPLLANRNFKKFRASLLLTKSKYQVNDEIDVLYKAAATLSHQLEELEEKVSYRTKMLIEQKNELSKERDFVANLLDTAQVIVLTQNANGNILTLNSYGEMLTHYKESELDGTPFLHILDLESVQQNLASDLKKIRLGQQRQFRHETITNCKDGSVRHVVWLHSHLDWRLEEDPAVLSVGLDVTEYKRVEGNLAWLADHDPLTNLFNRRRFSEELEHVLSWTDRYGHSGALLFFDLDRFKYVNDTSGHQAGDELLKMIAKMLAHTTRANDITGRLGGDEFAIILPEIKTDDAIGVAKKVLAYLNEAKLTINGRTHKISATIGIATFPKHGNNVYDLLAAADLAMYQAKETGRGAWHLFSEADSSRERMHTVMYWKEKIEYALTHDCFLLYLQPIANIKRKNIEYYEVLLRMRDKDGSIHTPAGFISVAEHTGLIHSIDHMVLRKAIALAAEINQNGLQIKFSINLSAHAFNDPELLPTIEHELTINNVDPEIIVFEITETAALQDLPAARSLMIDIRKLGCGFVLDDFGVGFSSFYYLRELPVDTVKLDGSFIRDLAQNTDDQILVKALCSVAKGFNKKITAEFVENEETLSLLETMDIDYAQGYFIGKPTYYVDIISKMNATIENNKVKPKPCK